MGFEPTTPTLRKWCSNQLSYIGALSNLYYARPLGNGITSNCRLIYSAVSFKRVLLKLSGEQFAGGDGFGIDSDFVNNLAKELKELVSESGVQLAIILGGGNFVRGKDMKVKGLKEETAHYMGMISIILNGLTLRDVLEAQGQPAYLQSNLHIDKVTEPFDSKKALKHMANGEILIVVGGTGTPFVTSDTAALSTAVKLGCQVVFKATKVDGVYEKDPVKYPEAKKHAFISYAEALDNPEIKVMDKSALSIAMEHKLPILVFELLKSGNLQKAVMGEAVGSRVS